MQKAFDELYQQSKNGNNFYKLLEIIGSEQNICPGSLSLMGLIFDKEKKVHLVIDKEVLDEEYFGCHPCINTSTLLMKTSDVKEKILPALGHEYQVVELPTE